MDTGSLLSSIQWGDEGLYVKEIGTKSRLPQIAKVIKGQYLGIGAPSLANPSLSSTVLLLSGGSGLRIAAQCVKFKEGRRVVSVGPKLAIPETYDGYFEILSEDGRAVKCIETVAELAKKFPDSCLVRENIKAFVSKSDDVETITEKYRIVQSGETLVLVGEVIGSKVGKNQNRFLRCFDLSAQNVYLPYESKGKFSSIAKEDNISGVHSIRNLLNKRLPLMVRLIHGRPPLASKSSSHFLPELRLFAAFDDNVYAAIPLSKELPVVLLPPNAPLKLSHAKNAESLEKTKEFIKLCEKGTNLLQEVSDRIHIYDLSFGSKGLKDTFENKNKNKNIQKIKNPPTVSKRQQDIHKNNDYDEIDQIYDYVRGFCPLPKHIRPVYQPSQPVSQSTGPTSRAVLPLQRHKHPSMNTKHLGQLHKNHQSHTRTSQHADTRPTPPPIETIPSRKGIQDKLSPSVHPALISAVIEKASFPSSQNKQTQDPESRPRSSGVPITQTNQAKKLFIKSSNPKNIKSKKLKNRTISPIKDAISDLAEPQSPNVMQPLLNPITPLYKLRHKSLTSLNLLDVDTVRSNISAEPNSSDSNHSVAKIKKPKNTERHASKLSRPKSLTNLFWSGSDALPENIGAAFDYPVFHSPSTALLEAERKHRLEPGVYQHSKDAPKLLAATTRLLASQRKIGTLYL